MKKISLVFAFIGLLFLCGCESDENRTKISFDFLQGLPDTSLVVELCNYRFLVLNKDSSLVYYEFLHSDNRRVTTQRTIFDQVEIQNMDVYKNSIHLLNL